jgi:hypothetical protein
MSLLPIKRIHSSNYHNYFLCSSFKTLNEIHMFYLRVRILNLGNSDELVKEA